MNFDPSGSRYDQSTFYGRFRYYAEVTNPMIAFTSTPTLLSASKLMEDCREKKVVHASIEELHRARQLYQSAFHPDTGELQNFAGRMCFNVWGGTMLCGAMMVWYKSTPAVMFWQWANQSFNALVNYTNRNAKSELTVSDLVKAYSSAVFGALSVAVGLKTYFSKNSSQMAQKLVPLGAVAVANAINIPMMRQNELKNGMAITDADGNDVGVSRLAAVKAISLVVLSRNIIVAPCMVLTPFIMQGLHKLPALRKNVFNIPTQLALTFILYGSMIPIGCAIFPQRNHINVSSLKQWEPETYERLRKLNLDRVYFNKGL